ncbi:hypothetical protein ACLO87_00245 [Paenalcaligenes sp. Me52]|uniref:hypothetical protein n=1 Tax=Paenalcaligenes sp. Me52 TaxID=3392038 RepID=UPI003D2E449D
MFKQRLMSAAIVAVGAGLYASSAAAEDFRLAYSKAEDIEIFVENASADNWCKPELALRAVYGASGDTVALGRLLPKLGALFAQQCPQAQSATWRAVNSQGTQVADGISQGATGWALLVQTPEASVAQAVQAATPEVAEAPASTTATPTEVVENVAPAPANTASVDAPPAPTAAEPKVASDEAKPKTASTAAESTPEPAQAAPTAARATEPTPEATAPVAAPEIQPEVRPAIVESEPVEINKDKVAATPAKATEAKAEVPATAATVETTEPETTADTTVATEAVVTPTVGLAEFAVGDWAVPNATQRAELSAFLSTLKDQNGCKVVSQFDLGADAAYLNLVTEGVSCNAEGYAQGKGRLTLERSDGAQIMRTGDLWFSNGLIFNKPVQGLKPADLVAFNGNNAGWFGFASDADNGSHYLLKATLGQFRGGIGAWQVGPEVAVLTPKTESFRQAAQIRQEVDKALDRLALIMPNATDVRLVFSDMPQGIWNNNASELLYSVSASRRYNYRTGQPQGDWQYNLQHAQNYLFQREARAAEQKRYEEERLERERQNQLRQQARVERNNLSNYQRLQERVEAGGKDALLPMLEEDIQYRAASGANAYARLVAGQADDFARIVRVDGSKKDDATVDWPYPMRLVGQSDLKKGWYWVKGTRSLDSSILDDEDLPMTMVQLGATAAQQCEKEGCAELLEPLAVMRMQLGDPDWTPEAAQAVIDSAPEGGGLFW